MRNEQEIFDDLARLCSSPGYVHAIALLCFRDNIVGYGKEIKAEDMRHLFSWDRLIRTEISTLIGLLIKNKVDYRLPVSSVLQQYLDQTEALLKELHESMLEPWFEGLDPEIISKEGFNPFTSGLALREPIFYGGESAYSFQYRDLSPKKYANDDEWLEANKGFSIQTARDVVYAVEKFQNNKLYVTLEKLKGTPPEEWTLLPGFNFTGQEIADYSDIDVSVVESVLAAFTMPAGENNNHFCTLNDFNAANASPLLRAGENSFILFQTYSLVEALYESPFYWMGADQSYVNTAMEHRGRFTEEFCRERLEIVFGKEYVHSNVDIIGSKDNKLGEIDVLILFGNRAIILQAKSKRLTLEARKGNDRQIRDDFKKSIQDAYDQGHKCAKLLIGGSYKLMCAPSGEVAIPEKLKEVYIFCVISDHYPALSFQSQQFLTLEKFEAIHPPFVMDVFMLDAMTEMLQSPLQLLSYANRRANYSDRLHASHELTILSHHLKNNLWVDDQQDMVLLMDDLSADLDVAMAVRRAGIPGKRTPDGILTRFENTALGHIVKEIETNLHPATIDFGLMVLTLSEDAVLSISEGIDRITNLTRSDRKVHDFTAGFGEASTGLTIHCSEDPDFVATPRLQRHCERRKYSEKANNWFGVCISPEDASLKFGLELDYKWKWNAEADAEISRLEKLRKVKGLGGSPVQKKKRKIGRNDPCPCGSGIKYKKCCMKR